MMNKKCVDAEGVVGPAWLSVTGVVRYKQPALMERLFFNIFKQSHDLLGIGTHLEYIYPPPNKTVLR